MPEITITITIPEGATLAVGQATVAAPRVSGSTASACPEHNLPWKHVPAGVSKKTGKPYTAFWACSEMGCNRRPPIGWKPPITEAVGPPNDEYDWPTDDVPF